MDKKLDSIIQYFAVFGYFPSFEDVYTFFPEKISKKSLKTIFEAKKYTPTQYNIGKNREVISSNETMKQWNNLNNRKQISKNKLNSPKFKLYIKLLTLFPQIKLIGLSGSIAMMNADLDDDIDLFIITENNYLFTARFLAIIIAFIIGLKRRTGLQKAPNKICLNLFFDESNLTVPKVKKTMFVGHEILQMKPIINKKQTYEKFLSANQWVFRFFPNARAVLKFKIENLDLNENSKLKNKNFGNWLESFLRQFQLYLIRKHQTTEIITDTQLWFHPVDFGKKIKH